MILCGNIILQHNWRLRIIYLEGVIIISRKPEKSFEDLIVWQKAMDLVVEVYQIAKLLPNEEVYALANQIKRAAVSIPSNIAEGHERNTTKDFIKYLYIARGSKGELETQLLLCVRLQYLAVTQIESAQRLLIEIGKMLNSLIQSLSAKLPQPSSPVL